MNAMPPGGPAASIPHGGPAASVIIPAYQAEAFVATAIQSALEQTLTDIEVIIVDDGSTDSTWEILLGWARRDARVVPLRQPCRGGPAAARNIGIAQARGRWLALLDADDLFLPQRLARMVAAADALGADLLADNMLRVDFSTGQDFGPRFPDETMRAPGRIALVEAVRRDMPERWQGGDVFGFFQPIIRRDFLATQRIRYVEDVMVGEDFLFYFECIAAGARFHLLPESGYVQRLRCGSLSHSREAMLHLSAANRRMLGIAARLPQHDLMPLLLQRQRQIDIDCFALLLERGEVRAALRHAHCLTPARLLRHVRAALGALRRRRGLRYVRAAASIARAERPSAGVSP
jgi:glycosyltransferase involved in cell wall biosynthesis